jgi:hypothetical protein
VPGTRLVDRGGVRAALDQELRRLRAALRHAARHHQRRLALGVGRAERLAAAGQLLQHAQHTRVAKARGAVHGQVAGLEMVGPARSDGGGSALTSRRPGARAQPARARPPPTAASWGSALLSRRNPTMASSPNAAASISAVPSGAIWGGGRSGGRGQRRRSGRAAGRVCTRAAAACERMEVAAAHPVDVGTLGHERLGGLQVAEAAGHLQRALRRAGGGAGARRARGWAHAAVAAATARSHARRGQRARRPSVGAAAPCGARMTPASPPCRRRCRRPPCGRASGGRRAGGGRAG